MDWTSVPKNDVTYQGLTPISYENVNRDNLKIGNRDRVIGLQGGADRGDEPYIISNMPSEMAQDCRLQNSGPFAGIPITRAVTDTLRITNFLASQKGINFIASQNFFITSGGAATFKGLTDITNAK